MNMNMNMNMVAIIRVVFLLLGDACPVLSREVDGTEKLLRRGLLPSPPHPPGHHFGPHHFGHDSGKYMGCLGLSTEELEKASRFKEDMPKCEIVIDGTTVVSNTVTVPSSAPAESDSSISDVATTTTSTVISAYEEADTSEVGTSGGSDDNIDDQNDEVNNENDGYDYGDQSSASGGEENYEDDTIDSTEDNGSTSESVVSGENEAASGTFTENQAANNSANVDGDETPNPLHLFDIKDCGSFSALWMWDLALTCSNSTSLESCSCTAAKILIQYGDIDCMNDECPSNCSVCTMCMKLSGCGPTKEIQRSAATGGDDSAEAVPVAFIGLTAAMFGLQLVLFKMYWSRRSRQPGGALGSHLMDQNVV
ncbi:hypothetical protein ACHAWT_008958 [Skeletonema menzelii]